MIGRFLGAISLGDNKSSRPIYVKMAASALIVYVLISGIVLLEGVQSGETFSVASTLPYLAFMAIQFVGFIIGKSHAARTLVVFSLIII